MIYIVISNSKQVQMCELLGAVHIQHCNRIRLDF